MATLGQKLTAPESGWRRYDSTDSRIKYTGFANGGVDSNCYGGSYKESITIGDTIILNFTGTKLRIISPVNTNRSNNIKISIDGTVETFTEYHSSFIYQALVYEKVGLANQSHAVIITTTNNSYTDIDAIDIDETGELNNYDYILPSYYLIKQNSNYYTIKTTNYDLVTNHNFTALTLSGGTTPNKSDIETFGFTDLSILSTSMSISSDIFKPIDKFDNQFEIKMYKQ